MTTVERIASAGLGQREPGRLKYLAFRLAAAVLPHVPALIARPLALLAGLALWAIMPAARQRVEFNLRHVPALATDPSGRQRAVRGVFRHLALNYLDFFRVRGLPSERIAAEWHVDNQDVFEAAVAAGRGVILITAHLGDFEYGVARLGEIGVPITLPVERLKPDRLFALACRMRSHHGVRAVPADSTESLRALLAALHRGEAVLLAVDRDVLGTGVEVPLFGEPARLPTGPVLLALRSGAPILWANGWRERGRPSRGGFIPVDLPPHAAGAETPARARPRDKAELARALGPIAAILEGQIAAHPEQWVAALAPIWYAGSCQEEGDIAREV